MCNPKNCVYLAAKLARKSDKHFKQWGAGGHYYGFVGDKSPRANRNRAQARLLAAMLKETADA
jgi:hypothetical protein